ncbi:MAG: hypothetical protein ACI8UO_000153 [Verrucomicrobiales bacterium]|jgi:hypothetical protein
MAVGIELRTLVWERAKGNCEYCQFPESVAMLPFQVDHIIAEKHDGPTDETNLAWSCERCNSFKGANISGYVDNRHVPLFNPRFDSWVEHFEWNGAVLKSKTITGEATIRVLEMNRPSLIELRRLLIVDGLFSPSPT